MGKTSSKDREQVEREDEDGIWPMSSFIHYQEYCSVRLMCSGCWAEDEPFSSKVCSTCFTQRPTNYSKTQPTRRVRGVKL